jgi:hypothetical protein
MGTEWIAGIAIYNNNMTEVGPIGFPAGRQIGQLWKHLCEQNYMNWVSDYVKTFNNSDIWAIEKLGC